MKIINGVKFNTFDEVFAKILKSKESKDVFDSEIARLRLIKQIREIRQSKKWTQETLAHKAGMPQSVIARLETGRHNFSLNTLYQLASVLGKKVVLV